MAQGWNFTLWLSAQQSRESLAAEPVEEDVIDLSAMAPSLIAWAKRKTEGFKSAATTPAPQDPVLSKYPPLVTSNGAVSQATITKITSKFQPASKLRPPPAKVAAAKGATRATEVTSEDVYECRELMRLKYALDVDIWSMRNVLRANRWLKEEKERRSDGAMEEIRRRVTLWNNQAQNNWTPEEWALVQEIDKCLKGESKERLRTQGAPEAAELSGEGVRGQSRWSHVYA
ncbi:hypothetical protein NA57DRAFT_79541 [Rhizodiscina lignyota]|uniref:Uncharacterized protein n=1 Tax=Rhizodiscina lignyota TaxID=1504668 RepID=A0A9P4M585_9PEZI|nr:hypothetical protein NA57DRAFT_79541 [Rhizodiscina lignyota]